MVPSRNATSLLQEVPEMSDPAPQFDYQRYQQEHPIHLRGSAEPVDGEVLTRCGLVVRECWVMSEAAREFVTCDACNNGE